MSIYRNYLKSKTGILHRKSEKDKNKTHCGKLISKMYFISGIDVRHKNKCCKICQP